MNIDEATELLKRMKIGKGKHEVGVCKHCRDSFCHFCTSSTDIWFCSEECEKSALTPQPKQEGKP